MGGLEQDVRETAGAPVPVTLSGTQELIAGQAGIDGGAGAVTAKTVRVAFATDTSLPAGTNAIGKLAANSGVDIGDVDVTSIIPGTGATNLGKAKNSTPGSTDTGIASLVQRKDSLSPLSESDGNYTTPRVDNQGSMWVRLSQTQSTQYQKANVTTATTVTPKTGPGLLHGIIVNKAVAGATITIYDNTSAAGTKIATITMPATLNQDNYPMLYDCSVSTGITIVTSDAVDITVLYT